jgi:hypothetical protein
MQLEIKTEDQIWLSENIDLKLYKKADASNKNLLEDLIEKEMEEYRSELEASIETATGENHDNKTWEELNKTVSTLPIISEE